MEKRNYWMEKRMREVERSEEKAALLNDPMLGALLKLKKEKEKIEKELYKMDYLPHSFHSVEEIKAFKEDRKRLVLMADMCDGAMWKLEKERAKLERGWPKSKRKQL